MEAAWKRSSQLGNLLERTIGDAGTYDKLVAWINAAGPAAPTGAADAHESLRKDANARVVEEAVARVSVYRDQVGDDGLVVVGPERDAIEAARAGLVDAVV